MLIALSPLQSIVKSLITTSPSVETLIALPAVDVSFLPLPSIVTGFSTTIMSEDSISDKRTIGPSPFSKASLRATRVSMPNTTQT